MCLNASPRRTSSIQRRKTPSQRPFTVFKQATPKNSGSETTLGSSQGPKTIGSSAGIQRKQSSAVLPPTSYSKWPRPQWLGSRGTPGHFPKDYQSHSLGPERPSEKGEVFLQKLIIQSKNTLFFIKRDKYT